MTVFVLLLVFFLLGYLLAFTPLGERIFSVAEEMIDQLRGSSPSPESAATDRPAYRDWLLTDTAVPDDLRLWYVGLDQSQAQRFERALHAHSQNTGLQLLKLTTGELDQRASLRNIYVEAVSIYSQAYRKAREAIAAENEAGQPVGGTSDPEARSEPRVEGKAVAEKRASRRRVNREQAGSVAPA